LAAATQDTLAIGCGPDAITIGLNGDADMAGELGTVQATCSVAWSGHASNFEAMGSLAGLPASVVVWCPFVPVGPATT
jgi:hypothetical protein